MRALLVLTAFGWVCGLADKAAALTVNDTPVQIAGNSTILGTPSNNTIGTSAEFFFPESLAIDQAGGLLVLDGAASSGRGSTIRLVGMAASSPVSTLAGSGLDASTDGNGLAAAFRGGGTMSVDRDTGDIYVLDPFANGRRVFGADVSSFDAAGASYGIAAGGGLLFVNSTSAPNPRITDGNGTVSFTVDSSALGCTDGSSSIPKGGIATAHGHLYFGCTPVGVIDHDLTTHVSVIALSSSPSFLVTGTDDRVYGLFGANVVRVDDPAVPTLFTIPGSEVPAAIAIKQVPISDAPVFTSRTATALECPNGGVHLDIGVDDGGLGAELGGSALLLYYSTDSGNIWRVGDAGDGILEAAEQTSSSNVCTGATGPAGADGAPGAPGPAGPQGPAGANGDAPAQLISITAEAAGVNCVDGGYDITVGTDTNNDGTLEASEVTSTAFACNGVAGSTGKSASNGCAAAGAVPWMVLAALALIRRRRSFQ